MAASKKITYVISVFILAGIAAGIFWVKNAEPPPLDFTDIKGVSIISPPIPLPKVNLVDHNGKPFQTRQFKGHWSLLFFGYSHCPDVCPTTLSSLAATAKRMPEPQPQYIFATLDSRRDTSEKLREYITYFNPDFIGLGGDKKQIDLLSEKLGVIYDYEGDIDGGDYIVNHYAAILVIDPKARLRAHILPPHSPDRIIKAFSTIRDYYKG